MSDGEERACEGPDSMYVKEHALVSGTIKAMLSGPGQFVENETNEIKFREIPSHAQHTNSSTEVPDFPVSPEITLELFIAANFLDC
uniref:Elongin-C n=1 Tax=Gouania willdenowi TaxID=441366 RepID=A0A8C5ETG4_GOUWI